MNTNPISFRCYFLQWTLFFRSKLCASLVSFLPPAEPTIIHSNCRPRCRWWWVVISMFWWQSCTTIFPVRIQLTTGTYLLQGLGFCLSCLSFGISFLTRFSSWRKYVNFIRHPDVTLAHTFSFIITCSCIIFQMLCNKEKVMLQGSS